MKKEKAIHYLAFSLVNDTTTHSASQRYGLVANGPGQTAIIFAVY